MTEPKAKKPTSERQKASNRERQRRHYRRHKALRELGLEPEPFPGQDASGHFVAGNTLSVVHGASGTHRTGAPPGMSRQDPSEMRDRAAEIERALRTELTDSPYIGQKDYSLTVTALARDQAMLDMMWEWVWAQPFAALLTEIMTTDETLTGLGGDTVRKHTLSKRMVSILGQIHQVEARADRKRQQLGLTPLSRARLGKDVASQQFDLAKLWAEVDRAERGDGDGQIASGE
jgi:hypothetical protein